MTAPLRHALVTGAAGFLGRPLCALLQSRGARVRAVDRLDAAGPWDELIRADLTDPGAFADLCDGVDAVFHLAAKTHAVGSDARDRADYELLNVDLTRRLLKRAVEAEVRAFLLTSSVKVLGEGGDVALDDAAEPAPDSLYGETKLQAERLVHEAGREHGLHTVVLRMPLIYGPGVKGNLESMIRAIDRGRFPPLPDTGNRRSLVDVRDVAEALVLAAGHEAARGQTYLVTDGHPYSTFEMAALIRRALGRAQPRLTVPDGLFRLAASTGDLLGRLHLPAPFDSTVYHKLLGSACYDSRRIGNELGFVPKWRLETALPEMVERLR